MIGTNQSDGKNIYMVGDDVEFFDERDYLQGRIVKIQKLRSSDVAVIEYSGKKIYVCPLENITKRVMKKSEEDIAHEAASKLLKDSILKDLPWKKSEYDDDCLILEFGEQNFSNQDGVGFDFDFSFLWECPYSPVFQMSLKVVGGDDFEMHMEEEDIESNPSLKILFNQWISASILREIDKVNSFLNDEYDYHYREAVVNILLKK